jgi:hypothetical protein
MNSTGETHSPSHPADLALAKFRIKRILLDCEASVLVRDPVFSLREHPRLKLRAALHSRAMLRALERM